MVFLLQVEVKVDQEVLRARYPQRESTKVSTVVHRWNLRMRKLGSAGMNAGGFKFCSKLGTRSSKLCCLQPSSRYSSIHLRMTSRWASSVANFRPSRSGWRRHTTVAPVLIFCPLGNL